MHVKGVQVHFSTANGESFSSNVSSHRLKIRIEHHMFNNLFRELELGDLQLYNWNDKFRIIIFPSNYNI